jgi:tRNA1Val (adenine37-N6)-methyltransferase
MKEIFDNHVENVCIINENLRIIQRKGGLKFGTDSYLLASFIKKNQTGQAADLGAGTGVISLFAAARCSFNPIYSVEIQPEFSDLIERNAALNSLERMIKPINTDVRDISSFLSAESCRAVFSNPPYMKKESGKNSSDSEMNTARREIHGTIDDFVCAAAYLLKYSGSFYTVYRPERMTDLFSSLQKHSLEPKRMITVHVDASSAPSLILVEAKKGAAPSLKIARPLIVYRDTKEVKNRKYTEDMERVYRDFSLDFLFDK